MNPDSPVKSDPRRGLPSVDRLVRELRAARTDLPSWAATAGARQALAAERERLASPEATPEGPERLLASALSAATRLAHRQPRRVVNATGIVLHTNLGRAPLAAGAAAAAAEAAAGYSDLELDLDSGRRGDRLSGLTARLRLVSGAPAAHVVNNNAAAVLLALDGLARGQQAIVSRGELVEIGGSFRVPDIIERAGVELVEVGTTNRTRLSDYERAIGPRTRLLLKVHRSNFELRGFVAEVSVEELAGLGRARGLPVVEDLGSGTLLDLTARGLPPESFAPGRLQAGADLVMFSGDKLLGGPQAGILLGRRTLVDRLRGNPLSRALRLDKMSIAALDWTLEAYLDGRGERELPVLRQLLETPASLEKRARELARRLDAVARGRARVDAAPARAFVGGGSLPGFELETWVVELSVGAGSAADLAHDLRLAAAPVLARVRDERLLLDVRTLLPGDADAVEASLAEVLSGAAGDNAPQRGVR